jgi:aminopeptidase N
VGSQQLATADTHTRVLQVCEPEHAFRFAGIPSRPVPSLLRGFSAPVKVLFAYTDEDLLQLASHDSDPVCRWDAAQRLLTGAIDRVAAAWRSGSTLVLDPALVAMGEALLDDDSTDPALRAAALAVPDLAFLVEQQPAIDLDALIVARNFVERSLASALRERLVATCAATRIDEPYAPLPAQVAKRSLRRLCLRLIGSIGDADARAMLAGEFRSATNMTDTVAALVALNDSDAPERDVAFDAFAERWSGEPLVLDKWFSLEATTQRADALERVRARMRHPAFDARNPNRVRSLIGAFAAANWRHFHATTGDGYRFVADEVLSLDRSNPMVASRIVSAFNRWRRFDPVRSALQRAELERIADAGGVSNDVREIVGKALAVP